MQHVQGYTGSHWTPPSGVYSLRIALEAARATANKTTIYYLPTLMAILVVIAMRRYYTACIARWRRSRAFIL
jgi:flagellar biosynthesis protein FliQ